MGELIVKSALSGGIRNRFLDNLLKDVKALDILIRENGFEKGKQRVGAEQELALIDEEYDPSLEGPAILEAIGDPHYTTEIGKFNLEINLDPFELRSDCFRKTERQLLSLLGLGQSIASDFGTRFLLTGILPTVNFRHLTLDNMTPRERYKILSDALKAMRGSNFEIHIQGTDELISSLDSVLFEACNTSFQAHLQIAPEYFVEQYNWALLLSGPVLSVMANSPLLLGHELWMETRIALFQQSIDTRGSANFFRDRQSRVYFGDRWLKDSPSELFKDQITRYPLILVREIEEDGLTALQKGKTPDLSALRLHNGTVYTWNRACYGINDHWPHLRIENRYIPSGPTVADEMANFAFWVGLMKGMPEQYRGFYHTLPFKEAKSNFYRAAKTGLETVLNWFGKPVLAAELIKKVLLPIARQGLETIGVNSSDIDRYLWIIGTRLDRQQTGAQWQVRNFRKLKENYGLRVALTELTKGIYERMRTSDPVCTWNDMDCGRVYHINLVEDTVAKIMTTDLYTIADMEPLALVKSLMEWKKIRHLPVEDAKGDLIGLVTATNVRAFSTLEGHWEELPIRNFMVKKLITVDEETPVKSAVHLMNTYSIGCLPVVRGGKLLGLVTDTDVAKLSNSD